MVIPYYLCLDTTLQNLSICLILVYNRVSHNNLLFTKRYKTRFVNKNVSFLCYNVGTFLKCWYRFEDKKSRICPFLTPPQITHTIKTPISCVYHDLYHYRSEDVGNVCPGYGWPSGPVGSLEGRHIRGFIILKTSTKMAKSGWSIMMIWRGQPAPRFCPLRFVYL